MNISAAHQKAASAQPIGLQRSPAAQDRERFDEQCPTYGSVPPERGRTTNQNSWAAEVVSRIEASFSIAALQPRTDAGSRRARCLPHWQRRNCSATSASKPLALPTSSSFTNSKQSLAAGWVTASKQTFFEATKLASAEAECPESWNVSWVNESTSAASTLTRTLSVVHVSHLREVGLGSAGNF